MGTIVKIKSFSPYRYDLPNTPELEIPIRIEFPPLNILLSKIDDEIGIFGKADVLSVNIDANDDNAEPLNTEKFREFMDSSRENFMEYYRIAQATYDEKIGKDGILKW